MNGPSWQSWAWGAGAAACGLLLCLIQPWRLQFRQAWKICRFQPWLLMAPAALTAAELLWQWQAPAPDAPALLPAAARETGDALARSLTWVVRGEIPAMILGAAFFANSAGLRRGLHKGLAAAFSPGRAAFFTVLLGLSAAAALAIPAVRSSGGDDSLRQAVRLLAAPWNATAATLIVCRLILTFETACRTPEKSAGVRWTEMTGLYTARLWLPVLAGTFLFPLLDHTSPGLLPLLRAIAWPAAALFAWLPATALRCAGAGAIHTVVRMALRRAAGGFIPFSGWLAAAAVPLGTWHLCGSALLSLCPPGSWWRPLTAGVVSSGSAALTVWVLGAWIAIQVDSAPPAVNDARSRPRRRPTA